MHVGCCVSAEVLGAVEKNVVLSGEVSECSPDVRYLYDAWIAEVAGWVTDVSVLVTGLVSNSVDADIASSGGRRIDPGLPPHEMSENCPEL